VSQQPAVSLCHELHGGVDKFGDQCSWQRVLTENKRRLMGTAYHVTLPRIARIGCVDRNISRSVSLAAWNMAGMFQSGSRERHTVMRALTKAPTAIG
jgi:hypothetical protein